MLANKNLADYYMEKYNLDGIIATNPLSIKYFSGFESWVTNKTEEWMGKPGGSNSYIPLFYILPYKGKPILLIPSPFGPFGASSACEDVRLFGGVPHVEKYEVIKDMGDNIDVIDKIFFKPFEKIYSTPLEAIKIILSEIGLSKSRIGIELGSFNKPLFEIISEELNKTRFQDCTELIRLIRMIKTEDEISLLIKSAELNELAMNEAANNIKEGVKFKEVYNKFEAIAKNEGYTPEHLIFSTYGCGVSINSEYIFKKNQVVLIDSGLYCSNYISDTGTTIFIGKPQRKYLEVFKRIYESISMGLNGLKPGAKCLEVNSSITDYLANYGIFNTDTHGHGLGLNPSEYPIFSNNLNFSYHDGFENRDANFSLEKNMVVSLEVPVYIFSEASYIIEMNAIITENGYKPICTQDRRMPVINQ